MWALTSARQAAGECPLITPSPRHEGSVLGSPVLSSGDDRSDRAVGEPLRSCRDCVHAGRQPRGRCASSADRALAALYERLKTVKGANAAKVAVAKRLLTMAYRVLSEGRPYRSAQEQAREKRSYSPAALTAP
jgi:hypothetical protein